MFSSFSSVPQPYSFTNSGGGVVGIVVGDGWEINVDNVPISFTLCLPFPNSSVSSDSGFSIQDFAMYYPLLQIMVLTSLIPEIPTGKLPLSESPQMRRAVAG